MFSRDVKKRAYLPRNLRVTVPVGFLTFRLEKPHRAISPTPHTLRRLQVSLHDWWQRRVELGQQLVYVWPLDRPSSKYKTNRAA